MSIQFENYLSDQQAQNINTDAFQEISNHIYNFITNHDHESAVLNAPMGHGKSTALEGVIKHLINTDNPTPLLVCKREVSQCIDLANAINQFKKGTAQAIYNKDGKTVKVDPTKQVLVITHKRLFQLATTTQEDNIAKYIIKEDSQRNIVIDEMPEMNNTLNLNYESMNAFIGKDVLKKLQERTEINLNKINRIRSIFNYWLSYQLDMDYNSSDIVKQHIHPTNRQLDEEVIQFINELITLCNDNYIIEPINKLELLKYAIANGYGRIYQSKLERELIISRSVDYNKLGKHLILDGTAILNQRRIYNGYALINVSNRIDYSRLTIHHHEIKTTKSNRINGKGDVRKSIAQHIKSLHPDTFVLADKEDQLYYAKNGINIINNNVENDDDTLPLHLLNTTGKNELSEVNHLALTSMPIFNPQYYISKALGLRIVEKHVINGKNPIGNLHHDLDTPKLLDEDVKLTTWRNKQYWFNDFIVDTVYQDVFASEFLQIIHRCKLRNLNNNSQIHLHLYCDENVFQMVTDALQDYGITSYKLEHNKLLDDGYNRDKYYTYAQVIGEFLINHGLSAAPLTPKLISMMKDYGADANEIGCAKSFTRYAKDNYGKEEYKNKIDQILSQNNMKLEIDEADKRKTKYITLL